MHSDLLAGRLICPKTKQTLYLEGGKNRYISKDASIEYNIKEGVLKMLEEDDAFYEGSYVATINWIPKSEKMYHIWPLWMISNNYLWVVRKYLKKSSKVLELGCGGGVRYFGKRFEVVGFDLSFASLQNCPENYKLKIQGDATSLPFQDDSFDAVISACFWEHISETNKKIILAECFRVLKRSGTIIFLYDIETDNGLISAIKRKNMDFYRKEFIEKDGHWGYQTYRENDEIFKRSGFNVVHIGIEKTLLQTASVYKKLSKLDGILGKIGRFMSILYSLPYLSYLLNTLVIVADKSLGSLLPLSKSRILITIGKKNQHGNK